MNAVSKDRLQLLFSGNRPKVKNGQKNSAGLGLVDQQPKGSFHKAHLNVLRAEDVRRVRTGSCTEHDDQAGTRKDNEAGKGGDDEAGTG